MSRSPAYLRRWFRLSYFMPQASDSMSHATTSHAMLNADLRRQLPLHLEFCASALFGQNTHPRYLSMYTAKIIQRRYFWRDIILIVMLSRDWSGSWTQTRCIMKRVRPRQRCHHGRQLVDRDVCKRSIQSAEVGSTPYLPLSVPEASVLRQYKHRAGRRFCRRVTTEESASLRDRAVFVAISVLAADQTIRLEQIPT
jgi:hypothetical protein